MSFSRRRGNRAAVDGRNWIYGSQPQNIHDTIIQGRPNGMPSFRNRIPEYQAWEIVAYVRSLSGLLPTEVAPARQHELEPEALPKERCRAEPPGHRSRGERAMPRSYGMGVVWQGTRRQQRCLRPAGPMSAHIEGL